MRSRRVYLALGAKGLASLAADGRLDAGSVRAATVTQTVRAALRDEDDEELEYDALLIAAEMVAAADPDGRVVVASADVDQADLEELPPGGGFDGYEVRLTQAVPRERIVSLHAADPGAAEDDELSWYDVTELTRLAAGEI